MYGIFAGFICGFFGAGGGLLFIPFFTKILKLNEVEARATSILIVAFLVFFSGIFYYQNSNIDFKIGFMCMLGGMCGSFLGSKLLLKIKPKVLKLIFVIFLFFCGVRMFLV